MVRLHVKLASGRSQASKPLNDVTSLYILSTARAGESQGLVVLMSTTHNRHTVAFCMQTQPAAKPETHYSPNLSVPPCDTIQTLLILKSRWAGDGYSIGCKVHLQHIHIHNRQIFPPTHVSPLIWQCNTLPRKHDCSNFTVLLTCVMIHTISSCNATCTPSQACYYTTTALSLDCNSAHRQHPRQNPAQ